ncbi:MAG: SGNH/GDSL hydrolase family protein [Jatrophihabitans sp.]
MPEPLPNPIRVLVKGPSTVTWSSFMGGPRTDFAFPRAIESELLTAGHPARVEVSSVPSQLFTSLLPTWEREVLNFSPDVIVLCYGGFEALHLILPRWLERHANSFKARPGRIRKLYRKRFLRPAWMALAKLQGRLDRTIDPTILRWRPRRFAAELEQYIKRVQRVGRPLVYVMEYAPVADRRRAWYPGQPARGAIYEQRKREVVENYGRDNVRFFETNDLVTKYADGELNKAMPDGFHFSPVMHRAIGSALAREIVDWAQTQPHLQLPKPKPKPRRSNRKRSAGIGDVIEQSGEPG